MTKQERLNELQAEKQFHKVLDRYFDAGWREFVKGIRNKNAVSNIRTLKIVASLKGYDFVEDLVKLIGKKNKHSLITFTKKPKGILLKDSRFKTIPELMMNQFNSGGIGYRSFKQGEVFIQVKENRWISFSY